jgi:hypothetical protein
MLISLQTLIIIAGMAHIGLCLASLAIPRALNWQTELSGLQTFFRQMFWNYAAYILAINLFFGLISILATTELLNGSRLGLFTSGFIALYWLGRLLVQFFYFDRTHMPIGRLYLLGEIALITLFIFLSITYALAFYHNFIQ